MSSPSGFSGDPVGCRYRSGGIAAGRSALYARIRSLQGWLQEQLFGRHIVLVTGRLDDDTAAKDRHGRHAALGAARPLPGSGRRPGPRCRSPPPITALPRRTRGFTSPSRRRGSPARRRRSPREPPAAGAALEALRAPGPAHRPARRGDRRGTCGAGAISTHGWRSTTVSSTRSPRQIAAEDRSRCAAAAAKR